jgi:2-C-methyl-D-erythritol 2,4-cyclodiphosphate synthase
MRCGIGYDIHRIIPTVKASAISVGGVQVPCFFKIEAHSDGDVLLHALTDAILGALALGDIGQWFPDTDPENRKRSSQEFLAKAVSKIEALGWKVNQCDSVIFLEEPKIAPHSQGMREVLARLLRVELSAVSIKAKTFEGLGPIGERNAIAAQAIVTLSNKSE